VKFNLTTGNKFNLGQSLCNLTKKALVSNALSFAAKLSAYSILLNIDDPVIFCTHAEVFKAKHQYAEALKAYDETIERFADSVIARSGRAEVLKEMGKYPEALKAYDETIERFANDRHVRNGLANLLILSGRGEEVPSLLNIDKYISKDDWRDYHVVAMSYLRTGNLDEAIQRLEYGLDNVPFLDSKEYFASALAYAKIKKKEYEDIETIFHKLPKTHNQFEAQKRHLFLVHSKAELHKTNEAIDELAQVPAVGNIRLVNLKGFLDKRYCLSGKFIFATTDEYACLDQAIEEEEFILVMTRKAA
jgi:tetratricopeptide (TPR) repeat protein